MKRKFRCQFDTLIAEGELIVSAAEKYASDISARLRQSGYIPACRTMLTELTGNSANQNLVGAKIGSLTVEQDKALSRVERLLTKIRDTAKRAFPGQQVKLHEAFHVGDGTSSLASVIVQGLEIVEAAKESSNAAGLESKGWHAQDTASLESAIAALKATNTSQEQDKGIRKSATQTKTEVANEFYERLLTIQNVATLIWEPEDTDGVGILKEFRIGIFPPARNGAVPKPAAPPQPQLQPTA